MRDILARANREVLDQYACSRTLLAFDFDGTLAPIVTDPDRAAMRPPTRRLLVKVAEAYPSIVISGRSRADARGRVRGVGLAGVIGNHGLEPWCATARMRKVVRRWVSILEEGLGGVQGVVVEDKGLSLSIHYRAARRRKEARARILDAVAELGNARVVGGKLVLNVLPAGAPGKGLALERARDRLGCDTAVYVGDDETDEDVFVLDQPGQLLAIRVGRNAASAAAYYIGGHADIDRLLRAFLASRPKRRAARKRRANP